MLSIHRKIVSAVFSASCALCRHRRLACCAAIMRSTPAGPIGSGSRRGGGWRWREPELVEQAELVEAAPSFDDLPVGDAEDVDAAEVDLASGGVSPITAPRCVPRAMKFSATRSPSAISCWTSLRQSGKARRKISPACRIPSGPAGAPWSGGSWLTNPGSRYRPAAVRSPVVNRAVMNWSTICLPDYITVMNS